MALNDDNTLTDERDPVTFDQINPSKFSIDLLDLTRNGSNVELGEGTSSYVELLYNQPDISVQTSNRFKTHETIGGPVVRQKLGEGEVEVEVSGVCTTVESTFIDELRSHDTVTLISNRKSGEMQVASTSTNPLEQGGAMNLDGNFTHEYTISLVEVVK